MNKTRFQVTYSILGGPNRTDGTKTRLVMAYSAHAVAEWITRRAQGNDYQLVSVVPVRSGG